MAVSPKRFRTIRTAADICKGVDALAASCRHMRGLSKQIGAPPLRRRPGGFQGLARIITGQQLSIASAGAIWSRLEALLSPFEAARLFALKDGELRQVGLSAPKIRTLRAMATAVLAGELDFERLTKLDDIEVSKQLISLHGIGPWTADIYTMFCLGRADAWAPTDLALQVAAADLVAGGGRYNADEMHTLAERWRPWRAVAARLLWAYYRHIKTACTGAPM